MAKEEPTFQSSTSTIFKEFSLRTSVIQARILPQVARIWIKFAPIASNAYGLLLKPKHENLPDPGLVFDQLLARPANAFKEDNGLKGNFIFVSFVGYLFEDLLKTDPSNAQGSNFLASANAVRLSMVYGRTHAREMVLRSFQGGKLKTSESPLNGEELPLMWNEISNLKPVNLSANFTFVLGEDWLNVHLGNIFWSTVFMRVHNKFCDKLAQENP
jgi:prostaglandin-endoperoxide synthase 2